LQEKVNTGWGIRKANPFIVKYSKGFGSIFKKIQVKKMPRRKDPGHFKQKR